MINLYLTVISMTRCIAFTGGGTGGHVFPALAVLNALTRDVRIIWLGSPSGLEAKIIRTRGIPFYGIPCGKLRRYFSVKNLGDLFKVLAGFFVSLWVLAKEKPAVVFSKGGYVSVPPVIAASILRIPVLTHESDLKPGLATRINARFAQAILVSFADSKIYFNKEHREKVEHLGNPVRSEILSGQAGQGRRLCGCPPDVPLLLVLGGSLGSVQINRLLLEILGKLTQACFVVHQMGRANYIERQHSRYFSAPFFTDSLPHILSAASLVLCRAGANTLWELAALGKPSLLIPLPRTASRGDQVDNARYFAERGAALVMDERDLSAHDLMEAVLNLIDNKSKLKRMGRAAQALSVGDAAVRIAERIMDYYRGA